MTKRKYSNLEIRDIIMNIIDEQGYIVPYDLVKKYKMRKERSVSILLAFEVETGLVKSEIRYRFKDGRTARIWKLNKNQKV